MIRKIKRNKLKNKTESNNIRNIWRKMQIKRHTFNLWLNIFKQCKGKAIESVTFNH
jgi:hypothetical protein